MIGLCRDWVPGAHVKVQRRNFIFVAAPNKLAPGSPFKFVPMTDLSQQQSTKPSGGDDSSDQRLLARVATGDRDALHELYVKYYQRVLRFIYRMTGQLEPAQEGVNDVMLVVWEKAHSFTGRSKVSTWIMGIAYHKGLKILEKSKRWSNRFKSVDFQDWNEPLVSPSEHTDGAMMKDLLVQGLKKLSVEQRAVVELTYFHGYSYQEISEIAGCPVNTVKTRMFHARAKLRKLLPALGLDEPRT